MDIFKQLLLVLNDNGKNLNDIVWFGTKECVYLNSLTDVLSDKINVFSIDELLIVGNDWWIEFNVDQEFADVRLEFKVYPSLPEKRSTVNLIHL